MTRRKKIFSYISLTLLLSVLVGSFSFAFAVETTADSGVGDIFKFTSMEFEFAYRSTTLLQNTRTIHRITGNQLQTNSPSYNFFTVFDTYRYRNQSFHGQYSDPSTYILRMRYCAFNFDMPRQEYNEGDRVAMQFVIPIFIGADFNSIYITMNWTSSADVYHEVTVLSKTPFDGSSGNNRYSIDYTYPVDCHDCSISFVLCRDTENGWATVQSDMQNSTDALFLLAFARAVYDDLTVLPGLHFTGEALSDLQSYEEYNFELLNDYFYRYNGYDTHTYVRTLFSNDFEDDTPFKNSFLAVGNVLQNVFVSTGLNSVFYVFLALGIGFLFLFIVPSVVQSIRGFVHSRHRGNNNYEAHTKIHRKAAEYDRRGSYRRGSKKGR